MSEKSVVGAGGTELAVTIVGDGEPLLLIPGLGATRVVFDPLLPLLAGAFTVVVYDQRGIGASQPAEGGYGTADLGDDAAAVLEALDLGDAVVLGASFGGMVAQQLTVRHPARVAALLLAASGPGSAHLVRAPEPRTTAALLGKGARTPEDAYRTACTVLYSEHFRRDHPEFIEEQVRERGRHPVAARAFQAQLLASSTHDAWDALPAVGAPTLVMHGSDDLVMPVENARLVAERIPGATMAVFDGAGHLFFHEEPERTAAMVTAFAGTRAR